MIVADLHSATNINFYATNNFHDISFEAKAYFDWMELYQLVSLYRKTYSHKFNLSFSCKELLNRKTQLGECKPVGQNKNLIIQVMLFSDVIFVIQKFSHNSFCMYVST